MTIEEVRFHDHLSRLRWEQGDHALIAGPTKAGKTTLVSRLVQKRSHVVAMVCKFRDDTIASEYKGWHRYDKWPKNGPPAYHQKIVLWPKPEPTLNGTRAKQAYIFREAFDAIGRVGSRAIVVDEGLYMAEPQFLNLGKEIGMLFYFGRSNGITMVLNTQRPAWIPKVIYSSTSHAWIARTNDTDDLKKLSDFGGIDTKEVKETLIRLKRRQDFVYLNPQGDAPSQIINTRR